MALVALALAASSNAAAQSLSADEMARTVVAATDRITERGWEEGNVWHNARRDAIEAVMLQFVCADQRYVTARWGAVRGTEAQVSALRENRLNAQQGVADVHRLLRQDIMAGARDENLIDASLIADTAVRSLRSYELGFYAAVRRSWQLDPSAFERDCGSR